MTEHLQYLYSLVSLALGGGLTWMATAKFARKQAEADAMQHFQTVYQGLIADLHSDRTNLRQERDEICAKYEELALKVHDLETVRLRQLEETVEANSRVLRQLARYAETQSLKCTDCVLIELIKNQTIINKPVTPRNNDEK